MAMIRWLMLFIVALLTFGAIHEPRALARRHAKRHPLPLIATQALPAELGRADLGPSWARPVMMFQGPLYATPNSLGVVGFMIAMIAMQVAHYSPNPSKVLLLPIPLFTEGGAGAALYGRF
jgi:hypothetical protein